MPVMGGLEVTREIRDAEEQSRKQNPESKIQRLPVILDLIMPRMDGFEVCGTTFWAKLDGIHLARNGLFRKFKV